MPVKQGELFQVRTITARMLDQMLPYAFSGYSMSRDQFEALRSGQHKRVGFVNHPDRGFVLLIRLDNGEFRFHCFHSRLTCFDELVEGVPQVFLR